MTSKQQMHSLEQFLAQAQGPSVSWADVDDDLEMYPNIEEPPSTDRHDHAEPAASSRQSRQTRVPILPRSPPFIIYCGNLSFNCTEQNLVEFFAPLKVREVRFAIDPQSKRPKGFGYVEFHSRDDMERAFERKAELLLNRPIRIDVQSSRHHENGGGDHHRPQRQHTAPPMHQSGPFAERQKLALQPRSVDPNKPSDTVTTQPKANPFGAARPREEVLKEKAKAAAATAPSSEAIAAPIQTSTAEKRSVSPSVQGRSNSAIVSTRTYQQRPAWGPVQSVLSPHAAVTAASDPSHTPSASSFQRQAWGSRGTTPRSNPDRTLAENQGAHRPNDRHFDMKQSGPNRHGPAPHGAGAHDRRGPPVRHPDHERRTGPRPGPHPNHGPDAKTGSYEPPHQDHRRPRHPHHHHHHHHRRDDERKASREKSDIIAAKPADTGAGTTAAADRQSRADRPRSPSPSHADGRVASSNVDDAGFEMPRKGRRNGSGRSSVSAVTSSIAKTDLNANSNSNRKEKNVSGATTSGRSWASRVQGSAHTDIPSSVSYSSNMFSSLATDDD